MARVHVIESASSNPSAAPDFVGQHWIRVDTKQMWRAKGTSGVGDWVEEVTDTGITQLTGDVTAGPGSGSQAATLESVAITGKSAATVASGDLVLIADIDDSNNLKQVTAQDIADLGGGNSPLTTKGDLYTFDTVDNRLPVGTDGQILSADSAETTGLKWIDNTGGVGGTDTQVQFNNSGVLDGFGSWNGTTLNVPSVTVNSNFTLPTVDGANGEVIATDGAGNLYWDVNAWSITGTNLYSINANQPAAGTYNVFAGGNSGSTSNTGDVNIAFGYYAGNSLTNGAYNVFLGQNTGRYTDSGNENIALGQAALFGNTSGSFSVGIGSGSGTGATTGSNNLFLGAAADTTDGTLDYQAAIGPGATVSTADTVVIGRSTATVRFNNAYSFPNVDGTNGQSLITDGAGNLYWDTAGSGSGTFLNDSQDNIYSYNTNAFSGTGVKNLLGGFQAGNVVSNGSDNIMFGSGAGISNDGNENIIIGKNADAISTVNSSIVIGVTSSAQADNSIVLGSNSTTVGTNSVAIGDNVTSNANQIVLGNTSQTIQISSTYALPADTGAVNNILKIDGAGTSYWASSPFDQDLNTTNSVAFAGLVNNGLTYPTVDGAEGEVITTNGVGGLSFSPMGLQHDVNDNLWSHAAFAPDPSSIYNVFIGNGSGSTACTGAYNTCIGAGNGAALTTGISNTLIGGSVGGSITTGQANIIVGSVSGTNITTGVGNLLFGNNLGIDLTVGNNNILIGYLANTGGYSNVTVIGYNISPTANGQTVIGGDIVIGNTSATGVLVFNGITYPSIDGSAGQWIVTDGAGNLNFSSSIPAPASDTNILFNNAGTIDGFGSWNGTTLDVPSVTINSVFTFPTTDGTIGQVLVTDGAGTVSWASVPAGGNDTEMQFNSSGVLTGLSTFTTDGTNISLIDADFILGTTTGTKFGTGPTEMLAFYGSTPLVQQTTSVGAASFTANTSAIADDTATFDGYTIGQIVGALRAYGLLA